MIAATAEYELSKEDYNSFKAYIIDKKPTYQTESKFHLDQLKKVAEKEKYLIENTNLFTQLDSVFSININRDLIKFQDEIIFFLENEIISRKFFHKGRIENSIKNDRFIKKAKTVFQNDSLYNSILGV